MTRMIDARNTVCTNNSKSSAPDLFLLAYGDKSVELRVIKDAVDMYRDSFLEKEKILEEEKRELEKLNYQVWSLENSLCEQIWQFSHKYDFSTIFQYHPFITDTKRRRDCKNERSSELIDLTNEIDAIKAEMAHLNQGRNQVKREVENGLTKLRNLQQISDDVTELLKLICPSETPCKLETISMPIYDEVVPNNNRNKMKRHKNDPGRAKHLKNDKSNLTAKEKSIVMKNNKSDIRKKLIFTTPKNYPQLSLEKSIIFTTSTMIINESAEFPNNTKFKSFTFKKRSEISIRFQQYHGYK